METEARLRKVVQWLPTDAPDFDIGLFADAAITKSDPGSPYRAIDRLLDLIEDSETSTIRTFGTRPPPGYFDALSWKVEDGMSVEILFAPVVIKHVQQLPPEGTIEALTSGQLTLRVHDDLPCGLTLLEDRVALCGYDPNTGILQAVIDTDDPTALEWAESIYDAYRHESEPIDPDAF